MGDAESRGGARCTYVKAGGTWETSLLSTWLCYELKTLKAGGKKKAGDCLQFHETRDVLGRQSGEMGWGLKSLGTQQE